MKAYKYNVKKYFLHVSKTVFIPGSLCLSCERSVLTDHMFVTREEKKKALVSLWKEIKQIILILNCFFQIRLNGYFLLSLLFLLKKEPSNLMCSLNFQNISQQCFKLCTEFVKVPMSAIKTQRSQYELKYFTSNSSSFKGFSKMYVIFKNTLF